MQNNTQNIIQSLNFLRELVVQRLRFFFDKENAGEFVYPQLNLYEDNSLFSNFLSQHKPNVEEYTILLLSVVSHIQPNFLDAIVQQFITQGIDFPEIGGAKSGNNRNMAPTGETALFILAGNDLQQRLQVQQIFSKDHFFYKEKNLWLEDVKEGEPKMSGRIILSDECVEEWLFGQSPKQHFGPDFPAKYIETKITRNVMALQIKNEFLCTLRKIKQLSFQVR